MLHKCIFPRPVFEWPLVWYSICTCQHNRKWCLNVSISLNSTWFCCGIHFSFVYLAQIDKRLKSLERCQSLEEIQRLFESADFESVVRLLQPTLNYGSRSKSLEFVSSAPERPAQLMLLQVRYATVISIQFMYCIFLNSVIVDTCHSLKLPLVPRTPCWSCWITSSVLSAVKWL